MPTYNQLRQAFGLRAEDARSRRSPARPTEAFPTDPELTPGSEINDPDSLDFVRLFDIDGQRHPAGQRGGRGRGHTGDPPHHRWPPGCKAIYGSVDKVDAFTGMVSEPHVPGTEFGELQLAMWKRAVPGAARRRPVLLRQRPGPRPHPAARSASTSAEAWATSSPSTPTSRATSWNRTCSGLPSTDPSSGGRRLRVPATHTPVVGTEAASTRRDRGAGEPCLRAAPGALRIVWGRHLLPGVPAGVRERSGPPRLRTRHPAAPVEFVERQSCRPRDAMVG